MGDEQPTKKASTESTGASFADMALHPRLQQGIRDIGYLEPTPIQSGTIPVAIGGRDLIGTAQTGTGKTAAFLLPILERLMPEQTGRTLALVLTPTRELALQAEGFLKKLGRHTPLRGAAVYGGVGMNDQERALRGGAEIIVATPGRLLDHMERGYVDFRHLRILVLDEGDRMLDMGFLPDVRRILQRLPTNRQTMLFSATMPPEIVQLSREFLRDPKTVQVGPTTAAAVGVTHLALPVPMFLKVPLLRELLQDETMTSVLVFARTKHRADRIGDQLQHDGLPVAVIHGDRSQPQRVRALEAFRSGRSRILVATDIAARGLDIEGVSHVVNLDVPHEAEVYIHRVGRTARAQRRGDAFTLVAPEEEDDFHHIEQLLGIKIPRAKIPGFRYDAPPPPRRSDEGRYRPPGGGGGRRGPPRGQGRSSGGNRGGRDRGRGPPVRRREERGQERGHERRPSW
ncbi:MAG: DEAD/DEAH box helicase [Thermoplasmata archaeon]|nr:DEAD/DEAH box helicase [Thermoplasmata archaeon]